MLEIAKNLKIEYFKKGDIIMKENDPSDEKMYVVLYGEILAFKIGRNENLEDSYRQKFTIYRFLPVTWSRRLSQ